MAFPSTATDGQIYITSDGRNYAYSSLTDSWVFESYSTSTAKNNLTAVTAPTITDNTSNGYSPGSIWIDIATKQAYTCTSATASTSTWSTGGSGASVLNTAPTGASIGEFFQNTSNDKLYMWDGFSWIDIVAGGSSTPKLNPSATTAPNAASDSSKGYGVGSIWINVITGKIYIATVVTVNSAVWAFAGDPFNWRIVSAAYTLVNNDALFCNTSGGSFIVTLPLAPAIGVTVSIVDHVGSFSVNSVTVARNGTTIMGLAADLVLSTTNQFITLTSTGSDWRIVG